jgi:hypothetical protein
VTTAEEAAESTRRIRLKGSPPMHYGSIVGDDDIVERFKGMRHVKSRVEYSRKSNLGG